jgi:hypothetical protein
MPASAVSTRSNPSSNKKVFCGELPNTHHMQGSSTPRPATHHSYQRGMHSCVQSTLLHRCVVLLFVLFLLWRCLCPAQSELSRCAVHLRQHHKTSDRTILLADCGSRSLVAILRVYAFGIARFVRNTTTCVLGRTSLSHMRLEKRKPRREQVRRCMHFHEKDTCRLEPKAAPLNENKSIIWNRAWSAAHFESQGGLATSSDILFYCPTWCEHGDASFQVSPQSTLPSPSVSDAPHTLPHPRATSGDDCATERSPHPLCASGDEGAASETSPHPLCEAIVAWASYLTSRLRHLAGFLPKTADLQAYRFMFRPRWRRARSFATRRVLEQAAVREGTLVQSPP